MAPLLTIENLHKGFAASPVLKGISLSLDEGSIFGLVGLNGAGKTTFFRLMLGLLRPDHGSIRALGFTPWNHDRRYLRQTGVILEHDGFWGNLSLDENIRIYARAKGIRSSIVDAYMIEHWSELARAVEKKQVKHFSRGQRMQASLCRAFLGWPRICFLDEPGVALDVDAFDHFHTIVRQAQQRGSTVLISSHQLESIEKLADVVGLLKDGRMDLLEAHTGSESWVIGANDNPSIGNILHEVTGTYGTYLEGFWHFSVTDPQRTVPMIVRAVVEAGHDIWEIRSEQGTLRERIRKARVHV